MGQGCQLFGVFREVARETGNTLRSRNPPHTHTQKLRTQLVVATSEHGFLHLIASSDSTEPLWLHCGSDRKTGDIYGSNSWCGTQRLDLVVVVWGGHSRCGYISPHKHKMELQRKRNRGSNKQSRSLITASMQSVYLNKKLTFKFRLTGLKTLSARTFELATGFSQWRLTFVSCCVVPTHAPIILTAPF